MTADVRVALCAMQAASLGALLEMLAWLRAGREEGMLPAGQNGAGTCTMQRGMQRSFAASFFHSCSAQ
jgi:hypothetical protein